MAANPPAPDLDRLSVDILAWLIIPQSQPLFSMQWQDLEPSRAGSDSQPAVNCLVDEALEKGSTC